jgi:NitT/TauT family transport system permease protein
MASSRALEEEAELLALAPTERRLLSQPVQIFLIRLAGIATFLFSWEYLSVALDAHFYVSQPSDIVARLADWVRDGTAFVHLGYTLQVTVYGFCFGASAGMALGLLLGLVPFLSRLFDPIIVAFYSLPKVALAPLFIVWFGIGITMKIVLSAMSVFFLVLSNTLAGVREVDRELVDVMRLMKATRLRMIVEVVIPSVLVWVFSGLRISVPYALIGAVTGEILTSNRGLGFLVSRSANQLDTTGIFAALVELVTVSLSLYTIIITAERRVLRWKSAGVRN